VEAHVRGRVRGRGRGRVCVCVGVDGCGRVVGRLWGSTPRGVCVGARARRRRPGAAWRGCSHTRSHRWPGGQRPGARHRCDAPSTQQAGDTTCSTACSTAGNTARRTLSSMSAASCARVLVGCGVPSGDSTSHITSRWGAPRMGSGTTRTGLRVCVCVCACVCVCVCVCVTV
jgi:hypothetical protein